MGAKMGFGMEQNLATQRCSIKRIYEKFKNFAKFTEKHLCQSLFSNKIIGKGLQIIKKQALAQVLSFGFYEIFKNIFYGRPPGAAFEMTVI